MFFFRKKSAAEVEQEDKQKRSIEALQNGGLPPIARERIERQRNSGQNFFSSDLSVREFLLAKNARLEILGQVMGTAFFKIGFRSFYQGFLGTATRSTRELKDLGNAILNARHLAVNRMCQEAALMGADGVIAVHLKDTPPRFGMDMTEFTVYGTAVKIPGWPKQEKPFTCTLTAQEFWQLHQSGYAPVSVAMGSCCYYVWTDAQTNKILYTWFGGNNANNQEINSYTQGFYNARESALYSLQADIEEHGAEGCIGMTVNSHIEDIEYETNNRKFYDMVIHFHAIGTSIISNNQAPINSSAPLIVMRIKNKENAALDFELANNALIEQEE